MKVLVNERSLEELRYSRRIGSGNEGFCYLPEDDNKIVKLFSDSYKDQVKKVDFSNLTNSQIAFPIDILYSEDNKIVGYTMNYLSGEKFYNGFRESLSLDNLKKAYLNIRLIMLRLKNIYMDDICLDNMLYDYENNKINIIDTSRWYEKIGGQIESISEFNWQMMTALIRNIDWKHYKLNHEKSLLDMYLTYKYSENLLSIFMDFLNELEVTVSEYKGKKVKTIKDLKI